MKLAWPRAWGEPCAGAVIRSRPEDFRVEELLGFEPDGEGEHAFLLLQKRQLNTAELAERLASLSGVHPRDVGYSGLKDRNAVTRQWFSVGLAGRPEPAWQSLEADGDVTVLAQSRHRRKLRRGVHRGNRFRLVLRDVSGATGALEQRLQQIAQSGVPNYFGEQRFGRGGATVDGALAWARGGRRPGRARRSLYLSALRGLLFNEMLAQRVAAGDWCEAAAGEVCLLSGSNSFFVVGEADAQLGERLRSGDVNPALPLWGDGGGEAAQFALRCARAQAQYTEVLDFLQREGLRLAWRSTRLLPDDFCWQFCDDGGLQLDFALGAGGYATALLAECVQYRDGSVMGGTGSEQG
ncbi:MAG: tRNA pseudouridine(13) synthase TruD [Halioglobus sp.]|nr:tRNA pseudouridine(13) synthase TruD [Halioglobus sp.]